jgi:hypothetical protein
LRGSVKEFALPEERSVYSERSDVLAASGESRAQMTEYDKTDDSGPTNRPPNDETEAEVNDLRNVLAAISEEAPPALELADALADATAVNVADAQATVYDAIDAGVLVEEGEGFGGVRVAAEYHETDTPETADSGDIDAGGAASPDANPNGETGETALAEPTTASSWSEVEFSDPTPRVWAPDQTEYDTWMCRKDGKAPYSPWTDADAPVECTHSDHDRPTRCDKCDHALR